MRKSNIGEKLKDKESLEEFRNELASYAPFTIVGGNVVLLISLMMKSKLVKLFGIFVMNMSAFYCLNTMLDRQNENDKKMENANFLLHNVYTEVLHQKYSRRSSDSMANAE